MASFESHPTLDQHWSAFLQELDEHLDHPVELHCFGGFVLVTCYGFPRVTGDIDYVLVHPPEQNETLQEIAGKGSRLSKKHKLYLQYVALATLPEDYEGRLTEIFPGRFRNLRLFVPDPYDLVLAKLERNTPKDREDVEYLARRIPLNPEVLRQRYNAEMRPYLVNEERHDNTLSLWIEAFFPKEGRTYSR
jgi:hypothetical protein